MGYRGFDEVICQQGHYRKRETPYYWEPWPSCPSCGGEPQYVHSYDTTNGYEESETNFLHCEALKIESGFTDRWVNDHYGNRYAEKHLTYRALLKGRRGWKLYVAPQGVE